MKNLAIIPARSGSKGLKNKNIKLLDGKPLLAYSIDAAEQSGIFDCIHVSTDSEKYAEMARKCGADVPFLRSAEMSSDTASSWDVVLEVLKKYDEQGQIFDMVTLLQPTSPLRTSEDIVGCYDEFIRKNANTVVTVCEMDHSPLWSNTLPENNSMDSFIRPEVKGPRQMLPTYYRINGAVYMVRVDFLCEGTDIYRTKSYAYIMEGNRSIDIDTELDFQLAEFLIKSN